MRKCFHAQSDMQVINLEGSWKETFLMHKDNPLHAENESPDVQLRLH